MDGDLGGPEVRGAEFSSRFWGKDHKGGDTCSDLKALTEHIRGNRPPDIRKKIAFEKFE